jgi:DNA-3-methyladenine glycosylase I
MDNYSALFEKIESSLKNNLFVSEAEYTRRLDRFYHLDFREMSDRDIFWTLVQVVFHAGVKSAPIERRKDEMKKWLYDFNLLARASETDKRRIAAHIGYPNKILFCTKNADSFLNLILTFGSFQGYMLHFGIKNLQPQESNLSLITKDLRSRFSGLGPVNTYHFLSELGLNVLKPDRVILRIFSRLGLISHIDDAKGAIAVGRKFQEATGKPIRVIDIVIVKYGQMERSEELGTNGGICLERDPKCHLCGVRDTCLFYSQRH